MKNKHLQELNSSSILQIGYGSLGFHFYKHISALSPSGVKILKTQKDVEAHLEATLKESNFDYIFLATKDSALKDLIEKVSTLSPKSKLIHFSGFHYFEDALGVHPVASFSKNGDFDFNALNFVADGELDSFLGQLFQKTSKILPENKKAYHTYLSVAANSMQLLSNQIGKDFAAETNLDSGILKSIIIQSLEREMEYGSKSFSGPWVRDEKELQNKMIEDVRSENLKNLNKIFNKSIEIYKKGGAL